MERPSIKLIATAMLGACLEVFDFVCFAFMAVILTKVFFSSENQTLGLIYTFAILATSYFFRPIGGILLAHFGDREGRKSVFTLTLMLMAGCSLLISILPTSEHIGIAAPIVFAILRILQGASLGGEVPGSIAFIAESLPQKWRAVACSFLTFGANMGVMLAALVTSLLLNHLTTEQLITFGWRIPFLLGASLGLIATYLRKHFTESPLFLNIKNQNRLEKIPLFYVFKDHKRSILLGTSLALVIAVSTATFHLFFPTYLTNFAGYKTQQLTLIGAFGSGILGVFSVLFAFISMRIGKKTLYMAGAFSIFLICCFAVIYNYGTQNITQIYIFEFMISLAIAMINGVFMIVLANLYPTRVRYTGISVSYNIAYLLGAGLTPVLNTYLIKATGFLQTPFVYTAIFAALTLIILTLIRIKEDDADLILSNQAENA